MNREIKFRAWDKTSNVMIRGMQGDWYLRPDGIPVLIDREGDEEQIRDYEIMQFTGLLDKNGKEIYEGDVLASKYDKRPFEIIWKDGIGDLQQEVGFWMLNKFTNSVFMIHQGHINDRKLEIIGNIYESPELLNN